jgi:hypothetical protein
MKTFSPSPRFGERGMGGEGPNRKEPQPPHPQPFSPGEKGAKNESAVYNRNTKWLEDNKLWHSSCQATGSLIFLLSGVSSD